MLDRVCNTSSFFKKVLSIMEARPSLLLEGLWDSPKALVIALLTEKLQCHAVILTGGDREVRLLDNLAALSNREILDFPSWETLPGEDIPPSPDIVGKRLEILQGIASDPSPKIVLCPLQAALQKVPSKKILSANYLKLEKGQEHAFLQLPEKLIQLGYRRVKVVADKGEFAVRGGILDIFPLSSFDPCRLEFFGDTIDQIRLFDPVSQKSQQKTESIEIGPADEKKLLQTGKASFFSYFPKNTLVILDNLLDLEDQYAALRGLPGAKTPLFLTFEELYAAIDSSKKLFLTKIPMEELADTSIKQRKGRAYYAETDQAEDISFEMFQRTFHTCRIHHPFLTLKDYFHPAAPETESFDLLENFANLPSSFETFFYTNSSAEREMIKEKLKNLHIEPSNQIQFIDGYLTSGFILQDSSLAVIPYTEITKKYKVHRQKWRSSYHTPASEFHELEVGDLVVHFHNGIGKFLGIEKQKNHLGEETEFFIIEYAENGKLYVPLSQSHLISRYIGAKEVLPPLHTLGTKKWHQAKQRVQQSIVGYAKDLLQLQAEREVKGGFSYPEDSQDMRLFEEDFPFEETPDQLQAISQLKDLMASPKAMDLLICGDVGYGKTEVAMRAAFKAAVDGGKQVAVLVPTTVLAMQHYETFCQRMNNFPVRIGVLSRFLKKAKVQQTIDEVKAGKIDILIGTHRLISKDVQFKDLGLLIIDEEQRFGVRAKESLKKWKSGVDCITLSATPIPRTLYLSLVGARELAVINTPPQDRLPIKSIICETDAEIIKNALIRELSRNGQAYFLHNRVETISKRADFIQKLLPSARIGIVHGQMPSDSIDRIFHNFKQGSLDILVATTIIESGVDIPNANTILIDRADTFGLADLYQLRGRVGRWNKPSYAYFLVPKNKTLSEISKKRLSALIEASGYGGGMKLAMRDLEIRGAGDILGVKQSGHVSAVGFHLYCKMLKKTVDAMKQKKAPLFLEVKMEYPYDAKLPDYYIPETSLRLELYHRLGDAMNVSEADQIFEEIRDRFGKPPSPVQWLHHLTRIRILAAAYQLTQVKFGKSSVLAVQQKGKKTMEKRFFLPQVSSPKQLEEHVVQKIKENFM
ncbi:MAG: transcription-repair coupling factor [Simkaniaceae bacterium]